MNWKARLKNKAFWVSVAALAAMIGKSFNLYEVPADYNNIVNLALSLFVGMGVLIDPTSTGIKDNDDVNETK